MQVLDGALAYAKHVYVDKKVVIAVENDKAGVQNREALQEADKNVHLSQVTKNQPTLSKIQI